MYKLRYISLTRKGSPQGHKDHCSDSVSQAHGAAKVGGQVSDKGGQETNDRDWY